MAQTRSLISRLLSLPPSVRANVLEQLSPNDKALIAFAWEAWARPDQLPPEGDDWSTWLLLGGRGAGKTRSGAEFIRAEVKAGAGLVGLIAPTAADARDIMVEGPSGLLAVSGKRDVDYKGNLVGRPVYEPSKRRLTWFNGARATLFTAEEPDRLRGPQHSVIWADELAAWMYLRETWDMAQFGLRIVYKTGRQPKQVVTTTPRPLALLREIKADPATVVSHASTYDNRQFLAPSFVKKMEDKYEGTRLGRQEINAEILDDVQGALWTLDRIDRHRVKAAPPAMERVVVGVDPSGSTPDGDHQGIVVCGSKTKYDGGAALVHGYVLGDYSLNELPAVWGQKAVDAYYEHQADLIVAEKNFGGEMVRHVIRSVDDTVPVHLVTASRGKIVRAGPIATMDERGRLHHVGQFKDLEDQMVLMTSAGYTGEGSPDRVDAYVWAMTELLLGTKAEAAQGGTAGRSKR